MRSHLVRRRQGSLLPRRYRQSAGRRPPSNPPERRERRDRVSGGYGYVKNLVTLRIRAALSKTLSAARRPMEVARVG